ncbi:amidase family protein [uncultured Ruegeria sp.]|uniref:amidase family protein n=1 Tax=uncultured Ruegeria sp. TaxID=259304 RepID=UPI00260482F2|nr:amidase family protein [uncultured Ruegeria sp.]
MTALIRETNIKGADSGALLGETLAVKANIAIAGLSWDGASPALSKVVSNDHASTVDRALAAGATIIGQANMHELAFGITSDNAHFGVVAGPHGAMAGGSSGGTAAAVAAGLTTMGLASDTGGSGRLPAAFCGCIGFRPSAGRYPGDGVLNLSISLDTVSAMAPDMDRLTRLDSTLADDKPSEAMPLEGLRLGRVQSVFWDNVDTRVAGPVEAAIERLCAAGAVIETRDAPDLHQTMDAISLRIVIAEAKRWWMPFLERELQPDISDFADQIASPDVAGIFREIAADETTDSELQSMRTQGRDRVCEILETAMDGLDVLVYPTVPIAAPKLHTEEVQLNGKSHALFPLLTDRALAASLSGSPAISLPISGFDDRPLGLEPMARPDDDRRLLGWATTIEQLLS